MEMVQVRELVNLATQEVLGTDSILAEDLSNVVDIGNQIFDNNAFDNYVKSLINHIGRVIFVNRKYGGYAPSVLMDSWAYGSVLQKITAEMPEAVENESWELTDNTSYDPNIFRKPKVSNKFFNKRVTFEIEASITELQVRESFSSGEQLGAFVSMLFNEIDKSITVKTDALVMRTINHFIAETLYEDFNDGNYSANSTARCVNLLKLYNDSFDGDLTPEQSMKNPEFIRFAAYTMSLYVDRLRVMSAQFNIGGKARFTPTDMLHFVMLSDFSKAAGVYLQSDTFHDELVQMPRHDTVPYWQGSGLEYSFGDITEINVKTANDHDVHASGILAVMFDRDALGVTRFDRRVKTHYNPKAEFTNYFYKQDAGYFNDFNENFVVFFVA
ncbi:MAG: hypothetical protein J6A25_02865 [Lachnospiraceae bacterium]|nr:hypothetical protein [Lachnospiraceae bacterium]